MKITRKLLLCCLAALSPALAAGDDYVLSCKSVRGRLLAQISVNGSNTYPFLLDTCLQNPVIDPEIASAKNLPAEAANANPAPQVPLVKIDSLTMAGIPPHPLTAAVMELGPLSARLGQSVLGVLPLYQPGLEATLNFSDASVAWRPLDKARLTKTDHNTVSMNIDESGAPLLPVLIDNQRLLRLQIDIARAGAVGLPRRVLEEMHALSGGRPQLRTIMEDRHIQTQVRLESLKVAGALLANPVCTVIDTDEPGWLGLGFLRHFRVSMNFEHGLIRLENARQNLFEDPLISGVGLAPGRFDGQYWQMNVAENAPAWRAGMRTGDALTAVDERPLAGESADRITAMLLVPEGTILNCAYSRNGESLSANLTAEPLL